MKLLEIKNLVVEYDTEDGKVYALNGVSLSLEEGSTLGLVGETGAGKTTTALSIMRLLPKRLSAIKEGQIIFDGESLLEKTEADMRLIRGEKVSMIFQDPMTSLNPVLRIGDQIREAIVLHSSNISKEQADARVDDILEMVGIPASRKNEYPHQFSGGMRQRVVIAMALSCQPKLLLADEPTTALDVTIQAQVLNMMQDLKQRLNTSMILITHDLGVVCQTCDCVAVMYAGEIVEYGTAYDLFVEKRHHPYTNGLFTSLPDPKLDSKRLKPIPGLTPDSMGLPSGCKFHPRCNKCMEICKTQAPEEYNIGGEHMIKCHLFSQEA
jgi:peptide/nickel transport system ATP-binding protein